MQVHSRYIFAIAQIMHITSHLRSSTERACCNIQSYSRRALEKNFVQLYKDLTPRRWRYRYNFELLKRNPRSSDLPTMDPEYSWRVIGTACVKKYKFLIQQQLLSRYKMDRSRTFSESAHQRVLHWNIGQLDSQLRSLLHCECFRSVWGWFRSHTRGRTEGGLEVTLEEWTLERILQAHWMLKFAS